VRAQFLQPIHVLLRADSRLHFNIEQSRVERRQFLCRRLEIGVCFFVLLDPRFHLIDRHPRIRVLAHGVAVNRVKHCVVVAELVVQFPRHFSALCGVLLGFSRLLIDRVVDLALGCKERFDDLEQTLRADLAVHIREFELRRVARVRPGGSCVLHKRARLGFSHPHNDELIFNRLLRVESQYLNTLNDRPRLFERVAESLPIELPRLVRDLLGDRLPRGFRLRHDTPGSVRGSRRVADIVVLRVETLGQGDDVAGIVVGHGVGGLNQRVVPYDSLICLPNTIIAEPFLQGGQNVLLVFVFSFCKNPMFDILYD